MPCSKNNRLDQQEPPQKAALIFSTNLVQAPFLSFCNESASLSHCRTKFSHIWAYPKPRSYGTKWGYHTVEQHSPIYGHILCPVLCPVFSGFCPVFTLQKSKTGRNSQIVKLLKTELLSHTFAFLQKESEDNHNFFNLFQICSLFDNMS